MLGSAVLNFTSVCKFQVRNATVFWVENLRGRNHSEDLGVDGGIILEWILGKWGGKVWTGCILLRMETGGRPL
jgi:hypothetical protein